MNILKKWQVWFWPLALILSYIISIMTTPNDVPYWVQALVGLIILGVPLFLVLSLIFNIIDHKKNKTQMTRDWKFWTWLILVLATSVFIIYIKIFNYIATKGFG